MGHTSLFHFLTCFGAAGQLVLLDSTAVLLIAKQMLNYVPNGRRWLGRPLKRLLDKAKTGLLGLIFYDKELYP